MLMLSIVTCFRVSSQTIYLADTALVTDVGYGGAPASCKANGTTYNAVNMDRRLGIWVADVFDVPAGATWIFDTVIVYGYQNGSSLSSPFISCNLQIYNGIPGAGGTVVWGDTLTNVLSSSDFTGIYKVDTFSSDNGLLSNQRPIMYLKLYLYQAPHLTAGRYWLAWSASCANTSSSPGTPYKVLPGRINPTGQMAMRKLAGTSWNYLIDNGDSIGLNMIIKASPTVSIKPMQDYNSEKVLAQNVPNPFGSNTTISYSLSEPCYIKLIIYNQIGQIVTTLVDNNMNTGEHKAIFNADNIPDGVYYYKLSMLRNTICRQMIIKK